MTQDLPQKPKLHDRHLRSEDLPLITRDKQAETLQTFGDFCRDRSDPNAVEPRDPPPRTSSVLYQKRQRNHSTMLTEPQPHHRKNHTTTLPETEIRSLLLHRKYPEPSLRTEREISPVPEGQTGETRKTRLGLKKKKREKRGARMSHARAYYIVHIYIFFY